MREHFNYSFFSQNISTNIQSIDGSYSSIHNAFWFNVADFTMEVDEEDLKYCLVLVLVAACLIKSVKTDSLPIRIGAEAIRQIHRVENPDERAEICSWLSHEDYPKFLEDAQLVLDSLL